MPTERLDPRVIAVIRGMADRSAPYAEVWRRVRPVLERRGLECPSYGAVRRIVQVERERPRLVDRYGYVDLGGGVRIHPGTGHIKIA